MGRVCRYSLLEKRDLINNNCVVFHGGDSISGPAPGCKAA
jgi:hypothetical protein